MRIPLTSLPLLSSVLLAAACGGAPGSNGVPGSTGSGAPSVLQPSGQPGDSLSPAAVPSEPPPQPAAYAHEWVVSPTGDDAAAGSAAAPVRTISKAISLAGPGDLIRVLAGDYPERVLITDSARAGTPEAPITLLGEGKPHIIPGSEQGALMLVDRPNWIIRGFNIDMQNHAAYGVAFTGDNSGTLLADSEIHHGHYGAGVSFHGQSHGATLENNHIHDIVIDGDDAHGVIIQPTASNVTVRNNVIHDNSGDAIQCYNEDGVVPGPPADGVLIEGNDLYHNVEQSLDIKTCHNLTVRHNKMHGARNYPGRGGNGAMVVHLSATNVLIEDNDFYDSGLAIGVGGNRVAAMPSGIVIRRNLIHDMITDGGMTGGGLQMADSTGTQVYNNTFTRLQGPALIMGLGDGGPTENLVVKNNIIDAAKAVELHSQAPGLSMSDNLYRPGATFQTGGASLDLSQWQSQGHESNSIEADPQLDPNTLSPGPAAVDRGEHLELGGTCGAGPDIGAVETGCKNQS
ncbi:MAG: right-handed parallel beta-helix repeat-containing protein [Archangium sp.]